MSDTSFALHELTFVPEGDEVVVGRLETGSYVVLPTDGAELLRRLAGGMTPRQAADWYQTAFGEAVDIGEFVETLHEMGFVRAAGSAEPAPRRPVRWQRLGRALFSPVSWTVQLTVLVLWLLAAAHHPDLLPAPSQFFFTDSLLLVQLVILAAQLPLLCLHEGYHVLAGRRLGLPSRLRLSNRLTYVVAETQMNGVLSVPRRSRYLPFLAGMLCDAVALGLLGIVADVTREADGSFSLTGRVCLALAFTVGTRLAWQFQLYLRTDLYYVFATALNCHDLHEASTALLRNRMWRALGRADRVVDERQWTEHDRRVGGWYGPFLALGIATFLATTAFVAVPIVRQYVHIVTTNLAAGRFDAHFWDAAVSLALNLVQGIALVLLSRNKRRHRHHLPRPLVQSEEVTPT